MKSLMAFMLAIWAVLTLVEGSGGIHFLDKAENPKVIQLGVEKQEVSSASTTIFEQMNGFFYSFNMSIGNPPQNLSAIFDTGSRDFVINSAQSEWCSKQEKCTQNGAYDASKSTTEKHLTDDMTAQYAVGGGNGSWLTDNIHIGDITLQSYQFGLFNFSYNPQSYWGFGYPEGETPNSGKSPANFTLRNMVNSGVIKSASCAFKLKEPGSLILGGLDQSLYSGDLYAMSVVPETDGTYKRLNVNLTTARAAGGNVSVNTPNGFPEAVMVDTGNFDNVLPDSFVTPLWKALNIGSIDVNGKKIGTCPCSLGNTSSVKITFGFGDFNLDVPLSAFIVQPPTSLLQLFQTSPLPEGTCMFTINPNTSGGKYDSILGAFWLEHVYTVFDADSHQVAFAKIASNPGAPDIREIAPGSVGLNSVNATNENNSTGGDVTSGPASPSSSPNAGNSEGFSNDKITLLSFIFGALAMTFV